MPTPYDDPNALVRLPPQNPANALLPDPAKLGPGQETSLEQALKAGLFDLAPGQQVLDAAKLYQALQSGDNKGAAGLVAQLGLAAIPMVMGMKAPASAVKKGFTAFHGSPADFKAFDPAMIGMGEDLKTASMAGYSIFNEDKINPFGFHLTESKDIANKFRGEGGNTYEVGVNADPDTFLHWDKSFSEQPEFIQKVLQENRLYSNPQWQWANNNLLLGDPSKPLARMKFVPKEGHFEISLRNYDGKMENIGFHKDPEFAKGDVGVEEYTNPSGKNLYDLAARVDKKALAKSNKEWMNDDSLFYDYNPYLGELAAQNLKKMGISGVTVNVPEAKTRNHIVFDPSIMQILKRY